MKRIFRIFGGISMFLGTLFLICGICSVISSLFSDEVENRLIFMVSMLLMAAIGIGLLYLGYRPYRKPCSKTETVPSVLLRPKPTPHKPRQLTSEERKRQELDQEERKRQWKEAEEQRKKARAEFLKPWQGIDPADAEHVKQWEDALEGDCAMSRHYIFRGRGDAGLDGTRDYTGVDWFLLHRTSNLKKAIQLYAQIDTYRKVCEAHGCYAVRTENRTLGSLMNHSYDQRLLILSSEEQFAALGEETETCMALCREHSLNIVWSEENHQYYDYVSGKTFEVYVGSTFAGSADDAATYGALYLDVVETTGHCDVGTGLDPNGIKKRQGRISNPDANADHVCAEWQLKDSD